MPLYLEATYLSPLSSYLQSQLSLGYRNGPTYFFSSACISLMALGYGSGGGSFPSLRAISFSSLYAFFFAFFSLRYSNWKKDDSHRIKLTVFKLEHFYNLQI